MHFITFLNSNRIIGNNGCLFSLSAKYIKFIFMSDGVSFVNNTESRVILPPVETILVATVSRN